MNVIEAAFNLGTQLRKRDEAKEEGLISGEDLEKRIGKEATIRFRELLDLECKRYCFYGYDAAIQQLANLRQPEDENNLIWYWTTLNDVVADCRELHRQADWMRELGNEVENRISVVFQYGTAEKSNKTDAPSLVRACDCYVATVKRTGAIRSSLKSMSEAGEEERRRIADISCKIDADSMSISQALHGDFLAEETYLDQDIRKAIIGTQFIINVSRRCIFWGYEGSWIKLEVNPEQIRSGSNGVIRPIELVTTSPLALMNRQFVVFRLESEGNLSGYLFPESIKTDLLSEGPWSEVKGIYYPTRDRGLFDKKAWMSAFEDEAKDKDNAETVSPNS